MPVGLIRSISMSSQLIGLVISAIGAIMFVSAAVGIPAVAIVCVRYLKLKERQLVLEMEYRQKSQRQDLATEERLRRIEEALNLGHEASLPELFQGPADAGIQRSESADPSGVRVR